jgi:hypothetical protein
MSKKMKDQTASTELKAERVQNETAAPVVNRLKAERVQLARVDNRLKAERVQERLRRMPGWRLLPGGRGIDRVKDLGNAESAADFAGFVLRKAARDQQIVRVEIQGTRLLLSVLSSISSGARKGIWVTDHHLDFAATLG